MSNPSMVIRIAANLAELRKNLQEGKNQIEATTTGMQKLATSFQGDRLIQQAHNVAAAVHSIGGASKLTEAEQARVNRTVEAALQKYQALGKEAPESLRQLAAETRAAEKPLISMSGILQGMVAGASAAVTAKLLNAGSALAAFGAESLARGDQIARLAPAFERLAGGAQQADEMLTQMKRGTSGLVDNINLMQSANRAMLLGLGLSAQEMGNLAQTATVLGRAMGQDATKSLDDLIVALGRSSPMILDNLGLTVKVGEANEAYAATLGKTVAQLTDAEKKQAFMTAAMEAARVKVAELGEVQLTASEHASKLWTSFRNLADAGANLVVSNGLVDISLRQLSDGMSTLEVAIRKGPVAAWREYHGLNNVVLPQVQQSKQAHDDAAASITGMALSGDALFAAMEQTGAELDRATERLKTHEAAAKGVGVVWGEMSPFVRLQIQGVISPSLIEFKTDTDNVTQAMQELNDQLHIVAGTAIQIQPTLTSTMKLPWVEHKAAVQASGTQTDGFFAKVFGGADGLGSSVSSIFQQAFVGGGGALGAVKAFATQTLSNMLGMIPGVGQWAQMFAGPIVAMLGKLGGKIKDFFAGIFGGPSRDELNGRKLVAEFEGNLAGLLNAQQKAEAGNESWKMTVIAIRDAYIAAGRTEEEALRDAERLWASSRESAEASKRVIEEIEGKMKASGAAAKEAVDAVSDAIADMPRIVDVEIRGKYTGPTEPGYSAGTLGRHGRWFADFGTATATVLHGREAVVREDQATAFARDVLGGGGGDPEVVQLLRDMPRLMKLAMREAMAGA